MANTLQKRILFCFVLLSTSLGCHQEPDELERRVVKAVAPPYDPILVQAHAHGLVRLRVRVSDAGTVEQVEVLESFSRTGEDLKLYEPFVKQWRFEPREVATEEEILFVYRFVKREHPTMLEGTTFIFPATIEIRHLEPPPVVMH